MCDARDLAWYDTCTQEPFGVKCSERLDESKFASSDCCREICQYLAFSDDSHVGQACTTCKKRQAVHLDHDLLESLLSSSTKCNADDMAWYSACSINPYGQKCSEELDKTGFATGECCPEICPSLAFAEDSYVGKACDTCEEANKRKHPDNPETHPSNQTPTDSGGGGGATVAILVALGIGAGTGAGAAGYKGYKKIDRGIDALHENLRAENLATHDYVMGAAEYDPSAPRTSFMNVVRDNRDDVAPTYRRDEIETTVDREYARQLYLSELPLIGRRFDKPRRELGYVWTGNSAAEPHAFRQAAVRDEAARRVHEPARREVTTFTA